MRIAVASGKGGTGKTLLATSLTAWLARTRDGVCYVDADVEAPNGHLFLHPEVEARRRATVRVPSLAVARCGGCGECQAACAFHAILAMGHRVMVFPELCHACGACVLACPERVLVERNREMGTIFEGRAVGAGWISGTLDVGEARSTPLVEAVTAAAPRDGLVVVDCPPGTSCPVVAALRAADRVVLVTEPTPFGLHDLELAVGACGLLGKPAVAVLNRADLGDSGVRAYLAAAGVPLVAEIPFDPDIAAAVASGRLAVPGHAALEAALEALVHTLDLGGAP